MSTTEQLAQMCKATTVMDDLPVVCNRDGGHTGPHVGHHDGEGVQWSSDEPAPDDEPVEMPSQPALPPPGAPVELTWADGVTPQASYEDGWTFSGAIFDGEGRIDALLLSNGAGRALVRWQGVDTLSWVVDDE